MKKILAVVSALFCLLLCSCQKIEKPEEQTKKSQKEERINGVWVSYIEVDEMIASGDFSAQFSAAVKNCKDFGITDIFFHTVPFCDGYYKSEIYPLRKADILATAVKISHQNGIKLHAWINPYRVKTANNQTNDISKESPAFKWLNDAEPSNDKNVLKTETGVYLNPAEEQVRKSVIDAVRELCTRYKVDGIHFDDYFYPTTDYGFDAVSYNEYREKCENPLSVEEYRTASVNALISGCYTAVKFINKDIVFSVSPAADTEKNRTCYYADVKSWCKSGCVDMVIPQLYFGFSYPQEKFCFNNLLSEWETLVSGSDTKLIIGLAAYKTGTEKQPDCDEWQTADDILSRQTEICQSDKSVKGQVYYSYTSLFSADALHKKSREQVTAVLDSHR